MPKGIINTAATLLLCAAIVGEVLCVIKAIECDWEPIGKAEIIYTGAAFTGLGCIVGWIDIEDSNNGITLEKTKSENE